jgi:hypothetical protein
MTDNPNSLGEVSSGLLKPIDRAGGLKVEVDAYGCTLFISLKSMMRANIVRLSDR